MSGSIEAYVKDIAEVWTACHRDGSRTDDTKANLMAGSFRVPLLGGWEVGGIKLDPASLGPSSVRHAVQRWTGEVRSNFPRLRSILALL